KSKEEEDREHDKADMRVVDRDDKPSRVWILEIEGRKVRQVTKAPWRVNEIVWKQNSQELIAKATDRPASDQWTDAIYGVALSDGAFNQIAAPRGPFQQVKLSSDGKRLAYVGSPVDGPEAHDLFVRPLG